MRVPLRTRPHPSALGATSTEFAVTHTPLTRSSFPACIEGKALLRIKTLCQHNVDRSNYRRYNITKVKSNSDHRNSISRERPPQARPSESLLTATPAVGAVAPALLTGKVILSFPFRTNFPRKVRPVTAETSNTPFLIERHNSVQSGDF